MKVGLCQVDTTVGDFSGNRAKVVDFARQARAAGAELAVFPELAVCGYPPEDLLLEDAFLTAHDAALQDLAGEVPADLPVLVGCLAANEGGRSRGGRPLFNAVALLAGGSSRIVARKSLLPTYDVFDECRYFEPWRHAEQNVVDVAGARVGVVVCEDGWNDATFFDRRIYTEDPVERVVGAGAEIVVNLSASPWSLGKEQLRQRMVAAAAARHRVPMIYVNLVGGDVELQFDGNSVAAKPSGLACRPVQFAESMQVVDTDAEWTERVEAPEPEAHQPEAMHHAAVVQGVSAYVRKFGFERAVIGLSGGIDSALVAALAVDALGADRVDGIAMPSTYSSDHSLEDARELATNLGIGFHVLEIGALQGAFDEALAPVFSGTDPGIAEENLQSRMRGTLLMAYANKFGHLLLTTGNKSEAAIGYCTLYGDTNGALAPIADLWKTEVWALSRWMNRDGVRIPTRSIEKPPSAELRPDQLDTDSLPPYAALDPVLRCLVEQCLPVAETAERTGMPRAEVAAIYRKIQTSEFKRYQYPPTVRVSERCWRGRRMPVSHLHRDS